MRLFKSPTGEVYAYELDGSQDHLIPSNFIAITEEEANAIRKTEQEKLHQEWLVKQPSKEEQLNRLQAQIDALRRQI